MQEVTELASLLRKNPELHIYELGDLDPFFFPQTKWFAEDGVLCLLYTGSFGSTLLAFAAPSEEARMIALLERTRDRFPDHFYTHLTPGLAAALEPRFELSPPKPALKMVLRDREKIEAIDTRDVVEVLSEDLAAAEALYRDSYPGNWFDARMLETGCYCGIREGDRFIAIAGVHVYSPTYRVAALGNIVTAHDARGRGLGAKITAAVSKKLLATVDVVGLNVMRDNAVAISCYRKLGFEVVADYEELFATAK